MQDRRPPNKRGAPHRAAKTGAGRPGNRKPYAGREDGEKKPRGERTERTMGRSMGRPAEGRPPRRDGAERGDAPRGPKRPWAPREKRDSDRDGNEERRASRPFRRSDKDFGDRPQRSERAPRERDTRGWDKKDRPRSDAPRGDRTRSGGDFQKTDDFPRKPRMSDGPRRPFKRSDDGDSFSRKPRTGGGRGRPFEAPRDNGPRDHDTDDAPRETRAFESRGGRERGEGRSFGARDFDAKRKPRAGAEQRIAGREKARRAVGQGEEGAFWIYGKHAVAAALANPKRTIKRLLAAEGGAGFLRGTGLAADRMERLEETSTEEIELLLPPGAVHQGLAVLVADLERARLRETCEPAEAGRPVVVLDQITDPQNIGAILRSAAAFGARAVIVQERRTPPLAGALAKAAAGAVETLPCIKVVNVARALEGLKDLGYFCAGLSGEAPADLTTLPADRPLALVLGAEGEGLRRLVAETCDVLVRIPIAAGMESLNVSNAGAVALFATTRSAR